MCGQKIKKLNPHRMSKQSVMVLRDLALAARESKNEWVRVEAGRDLVTSVGRIRSAYRAGAHAIYLQWFDLVKTEKRRSAKFRVTDKGFLFLFGQISVPAIIYCRDGNVVSQTEKQVFIQDVKGVSLDKDYWDNYSTIQLEAK
jgi:hypothetical protein